MNLIFRFCTIFIPTLLFCCLSMGSAFALDPEEVLVIANMNASQSKGLALYYMEKRQIPKENLVLLFITDKETCTRKSYEKKVIPPIRRALAKNPDIRALVTLFGLPLRISSPGLTAKEQSDIDQTLARKKKLESQLKSSQKDDKKRIEAEIKRADKRFAQLRQQTDKVASFDSELMLVKKEGYRLNMWLQNPYFLGWSQQKTPLKKSEVLMVSRLDGATSGIVKRIINDSMEAEKEGLFGHAYFDARWKAPGDKKVTGYALYDRSIHQAAKNLSKRASMKIILDDTQALFRPGESPNAAFYCGWYSLAKYIDAFTWQKGSVGFHIASAECTTLKKKDSQVWCKKMLDKGIAATIGPVGEPYVQSFPMPEIFFDFLAEGYLTLAESYLVSLPYLSWKMVLVGDPLYRVNLVDKKPS